MKEIIGLTVACFGAIIICLAEESGKVTPDAQVGCIIGIMILAGGLSATVWKD